MGNAAEVGPDGQPLTDRDDPKASSVLFVGVLGAILTLVTILGVWGLVYYQEAKIRADYREADLGVASQATAVKRSEQQAALHNAGSVHRRERQDTQSDSDRAGSRTTAARSEEVEGTMRAQGVHAEHKGNGLSRARVSSWLCALCFALVLLATSSSKLYAAPPPLGSMGGTDPRYEEIRDDARIVEKLGEQIPGDLEFTNSDGDVVRIDQLCDGEKPVILVMVYLDCPMLCGLVLDGMAETLRDMQWNVNEQFEVITVSFDPRDVPRKTIAWKTKYLKRYGRDGASAGWHWLSGDKENIDRLAKSVGFGFTWVEERAEFAHSGALIALTPEGKVSRYLHGVKYEPKDAKLALMEASEGKVGSFLDQVQFFCSRYDPVTGKFSLVAMNIVKIGALVTVVALVSLILLLRRREPSHKPESLVGTQS